MGLEFRRVLFRSTSEVICKDNSYGEHIYTVTDNAGNAATVSVTVENNSNNNGGGSSDDDDYYEIPKTEEVVPQPIVPQLPNTSSVPIPIVPEIISSSSTAIEDISTDNNTSSSSSSNGEHRGDKGEIVDVSQDNITLSWSSIIGQILSAALNLWWLWLLKIGRASCWERVLRLV